MCFGGGATQAPQNYAPYSADTSYKAVKQSTSTTPLNVLAAEKDAQDKPTAPVTGSSTTAGLVSM